VLSTYYEENAGSPSRVNRDPGASTLSNAGIPGPAGGTVYLVENDSGTRESVLEVLDSLKMKVVSFASAAAYLAYNRANDPACLIIGMQPDNRGADLQQSVAGEMRPPVIFISGNGDVPSTVRAMKAGAIECLTRPIDPVALVGAVREGLAQDRKLRLRKARMAKLQQRFCRLTPRQREVFSLIVGGLLNKQAASLLGISEVTLQIHRSQVMRKMEAESFADLVRMAVKLRVPPWRPQSFDGELLTSLA
jgi:FixJ family two-component response regulator